MINLVDTTIGNSGGGLLLFGVSDKKPRLLVGIPPLTDVALQQLQKSVFNSSGVHVRPEPVHTANGLFLLGIRK
jgi:hypothetical protein